MLLTAIWKTQSMLTFKYLSIFTSVSSPSSIICNTVAKRYITISTSIKYGIKDTNNWGSNGTKFLQTVGHLLWCNYKTSIWPSGGECL